MQGVYAWVNTVNGKVYVGSATDVAAQQEAQRAGWTSEARTAQAKRFEQQKLKDPTMLSRGGVKGAAVRWGKVN